MNRPSQNDRVLVGIFLALLAGCASVPLRDKAYLEDTDPEMARAIARAQATLPQFWQVFDQRTHGENHFVLVVRITDQGRIEHFQTTDFERRDGETMVTINRDPKIVSSVKRGDRIEIPAADITDWWYLRDEKYVGMFTIRAMFRLMPANQVEQFKQAMAAP